MLAVTKSWRSGTWSWVVAIGLTTMLLPTMPLPAQESTTDSPTGRRITFHGYLTQAYARSDGAQLLGITEDGTTDYRDLAFQMRYQLRDSDAFVIQLTHEAKGKTPSQDFRDDVEIDWAFYQHEFNDVTSVQVGRVPLPVGIYNEIRDVGTLLPFFAPPFSVYAEASFTTETVDGLVFSSSFAQTKPWSLDLDLYYGGWTTIERLAGVGIGQSRAEDAFGFQLWLTTPIRGLRVGVAANQYDMTGGVVRLDTRDRWRGYYASLDGSFDRFLVRAEYYRRDFPVKVFDIPVPDLTSDAFYVQLGVKVTEKLGLTAKV